MSNAFFIVGAADYVTTDGFDVYGDNGTGFLIRTNPIHSSGNKGSVLFKILNNKIHNNGQSSDGTAHGADGIFEDAHDVSRESTFMKMEVSTVNLGEMVVMNCT